MHARRLFVLLAGTIALSVGAALTALAAGPVLTAKPDTTTTTGTTTTRTILAPPSSVPRIVLSPLPPATWPAHRALPPLPKMPATGGHIRRIASATGACIVFIYSTGCGYASASTADTLYVAGQNITWESENLPHPGSSYTDYVLAPGNAGSPVCVAVFNGGGSCTGSTYTAAASGTANTSETISSVVAGIYVFASLNNTTNVWDAIAYVLVGSAASIETYSTGTLSTKTQTFTTTTSGTTTVYIDSEGLNPLHNYAVGVEDQITGFCVFTAPSSSQTTTPSSLCKLNTSTLTGTQPTSSGELLSNWGVTLAATPAPTHTSTPPQGGTYVATVFDQTTGQRVAARPFAIIDGRTTASTARVNLQFTSGAGTTAAGVSRIAWNGTSANVYDTYVNYVELEFGANSLPYTGDSYTFVVTDPNGNVAKEWTGVGNGTATIAPSSNTWNLPNPSIPMETAYQGSTWLATIYDATKSQLVGSQAFQVLGYTGSALWNGTTNVLNASTSVSPTLVYTNTSDNTFGANNGDPISEFASVSGGSYFNKATLTPPATGVTCTPTSTVPCSAVETDTAGNSWTVTLSCWSGNCTTQGLYVITVIPVSSTTPMQPGQSITVQGLTFYTSSCTGGNGCYFNTTIVATDGFTDSGGYNLVNNVTINGNTATDSGTGSLFLAGYYDSSNTYHGLTSTMSGSSIDVYTPRYNYNSSGFNQASLAINQPFTGAATSNVYGLTVKNTSASYTIQIFELLLPSAFNEATFAVDSHSPNGYSFTDNGYCDGLTTNAVCITPSTIMAVSGNASATQTFYFKVTPPSTSFSYTDAALNIIQSTYNGGNADRVGMTATTASLNTFIGTPTTVDSLSMGAYSINGSLMIGQITPSSVGTSTTNTLNFTLENTPTSSDPFPDYVDMVVVQVPNQSYISVPVSCGLVTVNTSGWACESVTGGSGLATTYYFGQCTNQVSSLPTVPATSTSLGSDNLPVCPFALPNEPYSLAPGSYLSVSIPVTAGATPTGGSPVTVSTWAHGATSDAWTVPITSSFAVAASATAGVGFSSINGSAVATGSEPQIISNQSATTGNTYVYKIRNTGNVAITTATITIPGQDITGTNGEDSSGQAWVVTPTGSPTATLNMESTGTADGCTSVVTNPSPANGTNTGTIAITCPAGALIAGNTLDVTFTALAPLKINSTYSWPTVINGSTATAANWFNDNQILVALSASVGVTVNNVACTIKSGSGNSTPVITTGTYTMNFGVVNANTYTYCNDVMTATVSTDSNAPSTWSLYVSASANPAATGAVLSSGGSTTNELNIQTDTANSTSTANTCPTSGACLAYDTTTYAAVQTTSSGNGTRIAYTTNGGSKILTSGVSVDLNEEIAVGSETVPTTGYDETLTFTWVAN